MRRPLHPLTCLPPPLYLSRLSSAFHVTSLCPSPLLFSPLRQAGAFHEVNPIPVVDAFLLQLFVNEVYDMLVGRPPPSSSRGPRSSS